MSKSVEEVRRELFEADFKVRRKSTFPAIELSRDSGGGYKYNPAHSDWMAWNAALDAVEIQLPSLVGLDQPFTGTPISEIRAHNHYNQALADCRAAIEQTGLGLKVL